MENIKEFLREIEIGDPEEYKNITYFPLKTARFDLDCLTLGEAISKERVRLRDTGRPDSLRLFQKRQDSGPDKGIFIIPGEVVRGGLQDRMFTRDSFIKEKTGRINLPVKCIEKERWFGGGDFIPEPYIVPPSLRKINLLSMHLENSAQEIIWQEIRNKIELTRTKSLTEKLGALFSRKKKELKPFLQFFNYARLKENGFVLLLNKRDIYIDIFTSPKNFEKHFSQLALSYSLEALTETGGRKRAIGKGEVKNFLEVVAANLITRKIKSPSGSSFYLYASREAIGSAFFISSKIIRIDLFSLEKLDRIRKQYFEDALLVPLREKPTRKEKRKVPLYR
jgi:hypothetical protein